MSTVNVDLKIELWPIGRLLPQAKNPRTHTKEQVKRIVESIKQFGWTNPCLAGAGNELLAGHGTTISGGPVNREGRGRRLYRLPDGLQQRFGFGPLVLGGLSVPRCPHV